MGEVLVEGGEEVAHQEETEGRIPPPLCIPDGGEEDGVVVTQRSGSTTRGRFISAMLIACSAN